ncbi:BstXI family restriction endonuclease [Enterobacteriaceae bacterium EKM102V]|uniref:BstXI family restriction endonuclease n=1 Tax=Pantoea TaxID=53335 RepID=UPI00142E015E|nr:MULTISPECIES: BstXI family restriction endonuclease [Pantoea]KAF6652436.1 BstXI family restriction endonuclease [Enterobacteriaceae bacterium EKM102V]KAF6661830.1 BstXI family restriction endonuclease [Pantoea sp. EKM103V]
MVRKVKLPSLLERKIYKTGQTRGADDDVIYQNRVSRNSTVLIPFELIIPVENRCLLTKKYDNGYIVLLPPDYLFGEKRDETLAIMSNCGLRLGFNCLVFYSQRYQYNLYNPNTFGLRSVQPMSRQGDLGGDYVSRVSGTTSERMGKISFGYNVTTSKGAGIRLFEYSDKESIEKARCQLEAIYWMCHDSIEAAVEYEMSPEDAHERKKLVYEVAEKFGLLDKHLLIKNRIVDAELETVCPLCLAKISAKGFFSKVEQQEFRRVHDLTVTEVNLFHINELRYGEFNHQPYNLGWGHHHCNVVVKDSGIDNTLEWMHDVLVRNERFRTAP